MNRVDVLTAKLNALLTKATEIRESGECLQGVRLERAAAGGTASKQSQETYKYARLRCGKGKALANGSKSQYVSVKDIPHFEAAIARGKKLTKLEKQISQVQAKLK
ncbi:hypothetical protein [Sivoneniella epilithica]